VNHPLCYNKRTENKTCLLSVGLDFPTQKRENWKRTGGDTLKAIAIILSLIMVLFSIYNVVHGVDFMVVVLSGAMAMLNIMVMILVLMMPVDRGRL
jgi:hypothetical protein